MDVQEPESVNMLRLLSVLRERSLNFSRFWWNTFHHTQVREHLFVFPASYQSGLTVDVDVTLNVTSSTSVDWVFSLIWRTGVWTIERCVLRYDDGLESTLRQFTDLVANDLPSLWAIVESAMDELYAVDVEGGEITNRDIRDSRPSSKKC